MLGEGGCFGLDSSGLGASLSTVVGLWVPLRAGNFLTGWVTVVFSRGPSLRGLSLKICLHHIVVHMIYTCVSIATRLRAGRPGFNSRQGLGVLPPCPFRL